MDLKGIYLKRVLIDILVNNDLGADKGNDQVDEDFEEKIPTGPIVWKRYMNTRPIVNQMRTKDVDFQWGTRQNVLWREKRDSEWREWRDPEDLCDHISEMSFSRIRISQDYLVSLVLCELEVNLRQSKDHIPHQKRKK
ncbi:hypothetical protein HDV00_008178 [Rhizophlyctis rosea]|nr:hypothetical protein HDV00_008178 [Rhizophlyctis rosea]